MGRPKLTDKERDARAAVLAERGLRVAALRERAGIATQLDAMRKSRISQSTLSAIESGKSDMFLTTACDLADLYGVPLDVVACRAPVPPVDEPFAARAPIVASPEFASAPENVREWFATLRPDGGERWSTVGWARTLEDGLRLSLAGVRLQPASSGTTPLQLVKPPSAPPRALTTPKPPSVR